MFTSNKVSKSMLDAVSKVLAEEEVQPKKKLILEPEKEKAKVAEEDEKKPASPFDWKNTPRTTMKPGERTGHEHKKTSTGNVFMKKYKKEKMEEEADCVTEPKAKEIAKKEVKGHEKAMHKEEVEQIDELSKSTLGSYVKSAARDVGASRKLGADFKNMADKSRKPSSKAAASRLSDKFDAVAKKRHAGIGKAVERLTKEEFSIESFMAEEFTEEQLDEMINEVLAKSAKAGDWIHDFVHSDNPKFKGKSKEKRKQMALAAYYAKQRNEEVEIQQITEGKMDHMSLTHLWHRHAQHTYGHDQGWGGGQGGHHSHHAATAIENHVRKKHGNRVADDMVHHSELHVAHAEYVGGKEAKEVEREAEKLRKKHGIKGDLYGHHDEPVNEEVQHLEELSDLADTSNEEALAPDQRTTDTLRGREKGGKHNQHNTFKVKLKAEEKVDEMKRPLDGDTFVTNEESPLKLAKHIAKKSFHKIRQETMMGKAGATSEEKENE